MSEPNEPRKGIAKADWEKFLSEFSARNKNRRARFDIFFASGETVEEAEEGRLESVSLGENESQIVVKRADNSEGENELMTDALDDVRRVSVQFETDGSENILEITDAKDTLFSLRLESKIDGNS